jgi:hypothetical protein
MWKLLAQSVVGTSHQRTGQPCQDSCRTACERIRDETVLILVAADGAGSAQHAEFGAALACAAVIDKALADLHEGQAVAALDRDAIVYWLTSARQALCAEAEARQTTPRELACTLLLAIVGEHAVAFAQIGDGAIVTRDGDEFRPVFWPPAGEYANSTNFLSEEDFAGHLLFERRDGRIDELAVFSDGLQRVALNLAARMGHRPFFEPLFARLRAAADGEELREPLRQFLESPRLAQRSDDDKTLILATRLPLRADATNPP